MSTYRLAIGLFTLPVGNSKVICNFVDTALKALKWGWANKQMWHQIFRIALLLVLYGYWLTLCWHWEKADTHKPSGGWGSSTHPLPTEQNVDEKMGFFGNFGKIRAGIHLSRTLDPPLPTLHWALYIAHSTCFMCTDTTHQMIKNIENSFSHAPHASTQIVYLLKISPIAGPIFLELVTGMVPNFLWLFNVWQESCYKSFKC